MRAKPLLLSVLAAATLAACDPPVPDSGASGAGFETPEQYAARREAELRTGARTGVRAEQTVRPPATPPAPPPAQPAPLPARTSAPINTAAVSVPPPSTEAERLAQETRAALGAPAPAPSVPAPAPLPTQQTTAAASPAALDLDRDNPGLSREQDFGAVSAERSIQDDAARVAAARQQYQLVQPTELERPNDNGPNIITYAIERARPVGASGTYRRAALASSRRSQQKCEGYRTADVAQEEFLSAGGPERDRLNLDPDGDGNACGWDPATFRSLVRNQ